MVAPPIVNIRPTAAELPAFYDTTTTTTTITTTTDDKEDNEDHHQAVSAAAEAEIREQEQLLRLRQQQQQQRKFIISMSSNAKAVTLLWIPRKMTEGPTRPLINMNGKKPSEYYLLRSETLQDRVMNAMFNHYGCGYDSLPPPLQRLYYDHIYKK